VSPTLVRPARRTLERGRRSPRRGDGRLFHAHPGPRCDVGPVKRVSSVTISPVQPSLPSRRHPEHCSTIPDVVGVRSDKTLPRPLLCPVRPPVSCALESTCGRQPNERPLHHHLRSCSWTNTGHAMMLRQEQDSPGQPPTLLHCTPCHHT
jgi:hypothetical protein